MIKYGFRQSDHDPCLFFGERHGKHRTPRHLRGIHYVPILVDDISTYLEKSKQALRNYEKFITALDEKYPTVDMGDIEYYLKQTLVADPDTCEYTISQETHVTKMLENMTMSQCNAAQTPFETGLMKQILQQGRSGPSDAQSDPLVNSTEYRSTLGSLNFPAVMTRPDLANTVSVLQRYQQSPRQSHMKAARHVLRYIQGTKSLGLRYSGGTIQLTAMVDSSWADDVDGAESQFGWVVYLCGGPVSWKSGLQRCTATSSTEAEYVALADLICELLYLTALLEEMGHAQNPVPVDEDNSGVFGIARCEGKYSHRRHINIKFHLCQKFLGKTYFLRDVRSTENTADIMTKSAFSHEKFIGLRDRLVQEV